MANRKLVTVEINSVDVTSYLLKYQITENFGNPIYEADLEFVRTINSALTLAVSQTVEIWEGYVTATDTKVFSGEVISFDPQSAKIIVKAYNKAYQAVRTMLTAVTYQADVVGNPIYPDGKYSDAFKDIVNTYVGLTADSTSVTDSGTVLTISKLVCDHTSAKERLDKIAQALGWIWYYSASANKVYMVPKQNSVNSTTFTIGSNVSNLPKWDNNKDDMINDLTLDGAFQEKIIEDVLHGNGSSTTFSLTGIPTGDVSLYYNAAKNYASTAPVQNELKTLGVANSTSTYDYTVDRLNKTITTTSFTPANASGDVLVSYVGVARAPVHYRDDPSVTSYGLHQRTEQLTDVLTVSDATNRVFNIVETFKNPFQSAVLQVPFSSSISYNVGDAVSVVDTVSVPNVNDTFTIYQIKRNYPTGYDELGVGNRPFDPPEYFINTSERIHRLERELLSEGSILRELRTVSYSLAMAPYSLQIDQKFINDSFVLDHPTNGVLYVSSEAMVLESFESTAGFSVTPVSSSVSNDSTTGHYWVGSQGVSFAFTAAGTPTLSKTITTVDLSGLVGVVSGAPTKGTFGVWTYTSNSGNTTALDLRIGNDASNYMQYSGQQYAWKVAGVESSFRMPSGQTLILFDANTPSSSGGTVTWSSIDYLQLRPTVTTSGNITFDYCTASSGDTISLNGLSGRQTTYTSNLLLY